MRICRVNTTTIELALEHAMFSDETQEIDNNFKSLLSQVYQADHIPMDFKQVNPAVRRINRYIYDKTQGKIDRIVTQDDVADSQMLLISGIFFKGQWKSPFNSSQTQEASFFDESNRELGKVNMMYQQKVLPYTSIAELNCHALELVYGKEDRLSMILLLPKKGIFNNSVVTSILNTILTTTQAFPLTRS